MAQFVAQFAGAYEVHPAAGRTVNHNRPQAAAQFLPDPFKPMSSAASSPCTGIHIIPFATSVVYCECILPDAASISSFLFP